MNQRVRKRNAGRLWVLVVLAIVYGAAVFYRRALVGPNRLDGMVGVVLGLYICSNPAANFLDLLFFSGSSGGQFPSRRAAVLWVALNVLVVLVGWVVIFIGTTQFAGRAA